MSFEIFPPPEEMTLGPQMFMMLVYGFILCYASKLIGDGSDILLDIYQAGIVGGLIIPILGAVPDGMIILISGVGGTKAEIQEQIKVGVGTLAGSTIMLLTVPWSLGVFLNRREMDPVTGKAGRIRITADKKSVCPIFEKGEICPLLDDPLHSKKSLHTNAPQHEKAKYKPALPQTFSLFNNVATVLAETPVTAKTMMLTSLTYLIIQIPAFFYDYDPDKGAAHESKYALIGFLTAATAFIVYCWFQLNNESHIELIARRQEKIRSFQHWTHSKQLEEGFSQLGGSVEKVFQAMDVDNDGYLTSEEVKKGLEALGLEIVPDEAEHVLLVMDTDGDGTVNEDEFRSFVNNYLQAITDRHLATLKNQHFLEQASPPTRAAIKKLENWRSDESTRITLIIPKESVQRVTAWSSQYDHISMYHEGGDSFIFSKRRRGTQAQKRRVTHPELGAWANASELLVKYAQQGGTVQGLVSEFGSTIGLTRDNCRSLATKYQIDISEQALTWRFAKVCMQGQRVIDHSQLERLLEGLTSHEAPLPVVDSYQNTPEPLDRKEQYSLRFRGESGYGNSNDNPQDSSSSNQDDEEEEDEGDFEDWTEKQKERYALFLLFIGTVMVTIFSDPMVEVIGVFGKTIGVDPFYVSFIVTPLASNASEVIASLMIASKKTNAAMAVTSSVLYGAATMNNTFCLAIFLALVYFQGLAWSFSAEVIAILTVTMICGLVGLNTTYKMYHAVGIILLFPLSLVLVWVLENVCGLE
eukprot:gb/GEZN01002163.1/.p1 GENE.gb/GEZN01002163.1/~~gb/GEZN01002163.1/.p1  ORF type:complete len:753 (+),score=68.42 gb/GEZN01002163.1/:137-2395(+)